MQDEGIKNIFKDTLYHTINSGEFSSYIGNGRDGVSNVMGRFRLINSVMEEIK